MMLLCLSITLLNMISLLKHNTKQWYLKTAENLRKFDGIDKNTYFNSVTKPKNTQLRYQMFGST